MLRAEFLDEKQRKQLLQRMVPLIEKLTKACGKQHPKVGEMYAVFGGMLFDCKQWQAASKAIERALSVLQATLGVASVEYNDALLTSAQIALALDDVATARRHCSQVIDAFLEAFQDPTHPKLQKADKLMKEAKAKSA